MYQQNYGRYSGPSYKPHRERGGCLTILLVLGTLGGVLSLFQGCGMPSGEELAMYREMFGDVPNWYFLASGFISFLGLICLAGLWMWQRWGWYGMLFLNAASIIIAGVAGIPMAIPIIGAVIGLGIWWLVLSPYWDSFE